MHYFGLGGVVGKLEVEAYLHHALTLPGPQRDLLAGALQELAGDHRLPPLAFTDVYRTDEPLSGAVEEENPPPSPQDRDEED
jgi:hypothetical protein